MTIHQIHAQYKEKCFLSVFQCFQLTEIKSSELVGVLHCESVLSRNTVACIGTMLCIRYLYWENCTLLLFHHRCPGSLVRWIGVRPPAQNSSHLHNSPTLIFPQLAEWGWMAAGGVLMRRWRRWKIIWWEKSLFRQRQLGLWPSCGRASCAVWGQAVIFAAASM